MGAVCDLTQGALSPLWSYHLTGSDTGATSLHQVFKLRPLARKQEPRRRTIQTRVIKLTDGRASTFLS